MGDNGVGLWDDHSTMSKLTVVEHSFYFNDGTRVRWTPVEKDGKGHGLYEVVIEFTASEGDVVRSQHMGPASAAASAHLLKWERRDRKERENTNQ